MHAAQFGASTQCRKDFTRIESVVGVERAFYTLLLGEICFGKHRVHEVAFLDANAVFTSEYAFDLNAQTEDVSAKSFCPVCVAINAGIIQNEGVEIAVAGMKNVCDAKSMFL